MSKAGDSEVLVNPAIQLGRCELQVVAGRRFEVDLSGLVRGLQPKQVLLVPPFKML